MGTGISFWSSAIDNRSRSSRLAIATGTDLLRVMISKSLNFTFSVTGLPYASKSVPFRSSYGLKPVCGVDYGGALSDALRVPFADHMLVKQPTGLPLSQTASLADSATDAFAAVAPTLRERPGAEVLVVGGRAQSLGVLVAHAALSLGARRVVYLDSDKGRLAKANLLGAEVLEAATYDGMEPVGLFPLTIDADATVASLGLAIRSVEPGGVCQRMYGDFKEATPVPLRHMYAMGVTLKIGRVNARARLPECLAHVTSGHYHPELMLTRRASFDDAPEAIRDPTMKVVFLRGELNKRRCFSRRSHLIALSLPECSQCRAVDRHGVIDQFWHLD